MTNLASFAELMKQAAADKAARAIAEEHRKKTEVAPLLSDLFKTVSTAKKITEKRAQVIDKIDELEANQVTEEDLSELVDSRVDKLATDTEKKLVAIVKKLQDDITNLKRHVDSRPSSTGWGGGGGGGEVKILRMDDIDLSNLAHGKVMTYDATLNKIVFSTPSTGGTTSTTDEEMPYSKRIDFISDNELYKGEAIVGASETALLWRIRKVTIGADNDVTEKWANGDSEYNKRWSDRLTFVYS